MKKINTLIVIVLTTLFVTSCTVEKRLYNKGFHVQWGTKYKADKHEKVQAESVAFTNVQESSPEENVLIRPQEIRTSSFSSLDENTPVERAESTDTYSDETLSEEEVITSHASFTNQQQFRAEVINLVPETVNEPTQKSEKKHSKKKQDSGESTGSKSQVVAFILVLLLGLLGIHRFYLGYPGIGILMLLTLGCFGILALVDLVRILVGDLKPKRGDYYQKF